MPDQGLQSFLECICQPFHGFFLVDSGTVGPTQLEPAAGDKTVELEKMRAFVFRRMGGTERVPRRSDHFLSGHDLIELAQVIEQDLGSREASQFCPYRLIGQIPE